ncbi:MAG: DNA topoisomerase VI subunit B, partial [Thermoplasmataceae archaeon]
KEQSHYREVSLSEFFEKNRHILGFDSPQKSLFMIVKEALDNSLDACDEYSILPEIVVSVAKASDDTYTITVKDNGPGIERTQVPRVFGQLLYGSRFHVIRQSRGQQGLGITAAILYGQLTTGEKATIETKRKEDDVAFRFVLGINVKDNRADLKVQEPFIWDVEHGTSVSITAKGRYVIGRQSIIEYLKECAVVNPHSSITFIDPEGNRSAFNRTIEQVPIVSKPVKPHPYGIEVGELMSMAKISESPNMKDFLVNSFSRVSENTAIEIIDRALLNIKLKPTALGNKEATILRDAIRNTKLMPPSQESLSPIGEEFIRRGMMNIYGEESPGFYGKPITRKASVYNGNPFSVEVGMVYGGDLPSEQPIRIIRYANKVPLLYQPGSCAISQAVFDLDWRPYGLEQKQGKGQPYGPAIILIHVYGPRLPYTSESKEAISPVNEISEEVKAAIRQEMRLLKSFGNRKEKMKKVAEKFNLFRRLIPEIAAKCSVILGKSVPDINPVISKIADVVFIHEETAAAEKGLIIKTEIFNFTKTEHKFTLKAVFGGIATTSKDFKIEKLKPAEEMVFETLIEGTGSYPGTDYYFTGIEPSKIQGAELLPGDWDLRHESGE